MPNCYNLMLDLHDLHQKSFCESSELFREDLWLDCILPGDCTLMPSCYNSLPHRHDLHQKSFTNRQCFFVKFFGLIVFSQAIVHLCKVITLC